MKKLFQLFYFNKKIYITMFIFIYFGLAYDCFISWSYAPLNLKTGALIFSSSLLALITLPCVFFIFPIYIGWMFVLSFFNLTFENNEFLNWLFCVWAPITIIGYFQWILLLPYLINRNKDKQFDCTVELIICLSLITLFFLIIIL